MALSDMLTPRVIELGSIKIGTLGDERKARSGKTFRLPVKLDYFWVTSRFRDNSGLLREDRELMDVLREHHADTDGQVRRIPISLLSDEIEDVMRCNWVYYQGRKCFARSDGVTLWKYHDFKTGALLEEPEQREWEDRFAETKLKDGSPLFKKHTTLDCVIRVPEARWGGVYRFRTTSVITGDQIYGSLIHIRQITGGVLTGMPLALVIRPMQVAPDGRPTTVYVVHVELMGSDLIALQTRALEIAQFQRDHREKMLTVRHQLRLMHDPGEGESDDEQSEVQQEFHPEPEPIDEAGNALRILDAKLAEYGYDESTRDAALAEAVGVEDATYETVAADVELIHEALLKLMRPEGDAE